MPQNPMPYLLKTKHFQQTWGSCCLGSTPPSKIASVNPFKCALHIQPDQWSGFLGLALLSLCRLVPQGPQVIQSQSQLVAMPFLIGMTFMDLKELTIEVWSTHDSCGKNQPSSASREWNMATFDSIFFITLNLHIA